MVYIEAKKRTSGIYYYHTRGIRQGNIVKKKRVYIGTDLKHAQKLSTFKESMVEIAKHELEHVPINYIDYKLTYSSNVLTDIFKENILISNLKEFDKSVAKNIDIEFPFEFIYNSNNIEGSGIPFEEVKKIVKGQISDYSNREEVKEAENSVTAYKYLKEEFKFNRKSILKLHSVLTHNLTDEGIPYVQGFKKIEIVVGKHEAETTHPEDVETELKELLNWYDENKRKMFPPELAFKFYFKYEKIHPFVDGNGRTGRMIMNKILINHKYQPMIIFKKNKNAHLTAFTKAREGKFKDFTNFMLKRYRDNFKEFYSKFIP